MMRSSVYKVLDTMDELEKTMDRMNDKASEKLDKGNAKAADYYTRKADDIEKQIEGMASCLRILGLGAWRECNQDTKYYGRWHIPLDDIERVC